MITTFPAIVLRPTPFQEGALVVSFLTERGERITGLAKGAKRPGAKWVAAFEPLSQVTVSFFGKEQTELRRITRCELASSPMALSHLESGLVIGCLADLFDRVAKEGAEDERLYRLLTACARELKARPHRALPVLLYAEHWLLHCLGLLPHPKACGACGGTDAPIAALDEERGWRCKACTPQDPSEALPPGVREYLLALRGSSVDSTPWDPGDETQRAVTQLLRQRLLGELGGRVRSYGVLHQLLD